MQIPKALASVAGLTAIAAGSLVASQTSTAATPVVHHPCPSGMVCIYRGVTDTTRIIRGYYELGPHTIRLEGHHLVINQLWDKRKVWLRDRHGKRLVTIPSVDRQRVDFAPIRSLVLQRACPVKACFVKIPQ